jgi:hypothetical protein
VLSSGAICAVAISIRPKTIGLHAFDEKTRMAASLPDKWTSNKGEDYGRK